MYGLARKTCFIVVIWSRDIEKLAFYFHFIDLSICSVYEILVGLHVLLKGKRAIDYTFGNQTLDRG